MLWRCCAITGHSVTYINGILLPKMFWPTLREYCSSDWEKLLKFEAEGREFAKFLRSLEQFIQTVKGQNKFCEKNAFLTYSWRFLKSRIKSALARTATARAHWLILSIDWSAEKILLLPQLRITPITWAII